jgi:hypothetical protein
MIRTFRHFFDPVAASPIKGKTADLTVEEIEDAGIREVLQTPGAALGSWALLDSLLEPSGSGSTIQDRLAANPEKAHTRDAPRISTASGMPNAMIALMIAHLQRVAQRLGVPMMRLGSMMRYSW